MSMTGPDAELGTFVLEAARIGGMIVAAPLGWTQAPMRVRATLALLVAIAAHGVVPGAPLASLGSLVRAMPAELLVGVAMGLVVRLAVFAFELAGEVIAPLIGLGAAHLFDPHLQQSESALTRMLRLLGTMLALLLGVHRIAIASVVASFRILPAGADVSPALAAPVLARTCADAFVAGTRLALPVVAVLVLVQVALAFVSRAAPAMQIFSVGFALTLIIGAATLSSALPDVARSIASDLSQIPDRVEAVVAAIVEG